MAGTSAQDERRQKRKDNIIILLRGGCDVTTACKASGVKSTDTFYRWLKEDEEFAERFKEAEGSALAYHTLNIRNHAKGDWKASAWWLERRYPKVYGRREKVELMGEDGGPVKVQQAEDISALLRHMTDEELDAFEKAELAKAMARSRLESAATDEPAEEAEEPEPSPAD